MKVALCLHGHFRCFDNHWHEYRDHLISRCNPDVFAFAWSDSFGHHSTNAGDNALVHKGYDTSSPRVPPEYLDSIRDRLNPKTAIFKSYDDYDQMFQNLVDSWRGTGYLDVAAANHKPKGTLSMVYGRGQAIKAKAAYEAANDFKYDLVIVTRWDVNHPYPLDIEADIDPTIVNATGTAHEFPWDWWTIGPSHLIDLWGEQSEGINELIAIGKYTNNTHYWQKNWFEHRNIPWRSFWNHTTVARE